MRAKSLLIIFTLMVTAITIQAQQNSTEEYFGKEFNAKGAVPATKLPKKIGEDEAVSLKVKGTILEVCQAKGCWMTLDIGNDQSMRVKFKDYGFFVPKDAAGKTAVIEGVAKKEIISVEELQHLAEDAGKSAEEIKAIEQPHEELTFTASGVIIK